MRTGIELAGETAQKRPGVRAFVATDVKVFVHGNRYYAFQKHSTIFNRYFEAFGRLTLCTRYCRADEIDEALRDITDMIEATLEVNSLHKAFLNRYNPSMRDAMKGCGLVICRCESIIAFKAADVARASGIPVLAEAMSDAWDAYWNHSVQGKCIAPYMYFKMKRTLKNADYAAYVTSAYLQRRYPCGGRTISASNVLIRATGKEVLDRRMAQIDRFDRQNVTLMTTAAIDVKYKGQQYVIKAIKRLNERGIRIRYLLVGEGDRSRLLKLAEREGVADQVVFTGRLTLEKVFSLLDEADIYIQPSLQEGLPRSVIEAMSRGCACIGAKTAGIPELLTGDMVVKRRSVRSIVDGIMNYIGYSSEKKRELAIRNREESDNYIIETLDARRRQFYEGILSDIRAGDRA